MGNNRSVEYNTHRHVLNKIGRLAARLCIQRKRNASVRLLTGMLGKPAKNHEYMPGEKRRIAEGRREAI